MWASAFPMPNCVEPLRVKISQPASFVFGDILQIQMFEPFLVLIQNVQNGLAANGNMGPSHKLGLAVLTECVSMYAARIDGEYLGEQCFEP